MHIHTHYNFFQGLLHTPAYRKQEAQNVARAIEILESIGDNAPVVTWRRNKEKVTAHAQEVYREARRYYRMSLDAGYAPAQERLDAIDAKITQ
jgi:hypothetical protein